MVKNSKNNSKNGEGYFPLVIPMIFGVVALVAASRIMLPLAALAGLGWGVKRYWQKTQNKQAQIHTIFYQLIQDNQGRITSLDLAMKANISGSEAQKYLEKQATEFAANFDVTDQGGIIYYFDTAFCKPAQSVDFLEQSSASMVEMTADSSIIQPTLSPESMVENGTHPVFWQNAIFDGPITQTEIAKRLNVHPTTVSKWKTKSEFSQWSRSKDPSDIAWRYDSESKRFFPISSERSVK
jgi:hypothetical protein